MNTKRRIEALEKIAVPVEAFGTHSLRIEVTNCERCDVALQRELEKKGISLSEVRSITILGDIHTRPMRDFQNHPEWELLQELNKSQRIWFILFVKTKEEWEEYQEYKRTSKGII